MVEIAKLLTIQPTPLTREEKQRVYSMLSNRAVFMAFATAAQQVVESTIERSIHANILDPRIAEEVLRMQGERVGIVKFFETLEELFKEQKEEEHRDE